MRVLSTAIFLLAGAACAREPALLYESEGRPLNKAVDLSDGSVVISRPGSEPGETELWYQPNKGEGRVLFPAPGADDRPTVLSDRKILFISTRTTIASLWVGDLVTGELTQLTNRGLSAGKPRVNFTPPPHGPITVREDSVEYDAGGGELITVSLRGVR